MLHLSGQKMFTVWQIRNEHFSDGITQILNLWTNFNIYPHSYNQNEIIFLMVLCKLRTTNNKWLAKEKVKAQSRFIINGRIVVNQHKNGIIKKKKNSLSMTKVIHKPCLSVWHIILLTTTKKHIRSAFPMRFNHVLVQSTFLR